MKGFAIGWPDFFMTVGEAVLPHVGLYRAARYVAERHYGEGLHKPGVKQIVLARIHEMAGELKLAEEYLMEAATLRPDAYHVHLAQFLARVGRHDDAVKAFEKALRVMPLPPMSDFIEKRLSELRAANHDTAHRR